MDKKLNDEGEDQELDHHKKLYESLCYGIYEQLCEQEVKKFDLNSNDKMIIASFLFILFFLVFMFFTSNDWRHCFLSMAPALTYSLGYFLGRIRSCYQ